MWWNLIAKLVLKPLAACGDEMLWYSQGEDLGFSSKPVVRSLVQLWGPKSDQTWANVNFVNFVNCLFNFLEAESGRCKRRGTILNDFDSDFDFETSMGAGDMLPRSFRWGAVNIINVALRRKTLHRGAIGFAPQGRFGAQRAWCIWWYRSNLFAVKKQQNICIYLFS